MHYVSTAVRITIVVFIADFLLQGVSSSYIPDRACEIHSQEGNVTIGGILPTYYKEKLACDGTYWSSVISMVESMTYAIRLVNQRDDILPNVTLGYEIRNDCADEDVTVWSVLSMLSHSANQEFQKVCPVARRAKSGRIIGIVGTSRSSTSLYAAKVASVYNVPMISFYATSDELSDADRFPFFLRTVPPDEYQVGAIIDLLLHFNWKYIALFYSIDSYGVHGAGQIQKLSEILGICIAINLPVSSSPTKLEIKEIADRLIENDKVTVIVIFSFSRQAYGVQQAILKHNIRRNFTFVGSDGWGVDLKKREDTKDLLHGSLFIRLYKQVVDEFRDYYGKLPTQLYLASEWYQSMIHQIAESNNCSDWDSCPLPASNQEMQVINAVFSFAFALHDSIESKCEMYSLCDEAIDGDTYLKHLLNVSFDGPGGHFKFDENGDASGKYSIKSWQPVNGVYTMVDVGVWDPEDHVNRLHINEESIKWKSEKGEVPVSLCIETCAANEIPIPSQKKCCWHCQKCPDYAKVVNGSRCEECSRLEWPNDKYTECLPIHPDYVSVNDPIIVAIIIVATLGILLCLLAMVALWIYRQHRLIKASSRELSCVNLIGLTLSCVASLLTTIRPSPSSCSILETCISIGFTLIFAPILFKVNRIWRIFQASGKSVERPRFVRPKEQFILTSCVILAQVFITSVSQVIGPSKPVTIITLQHQPFLSIYCQLGTGFIASCSYNMLLVGVCCYYAFRARKVPSNFNESKFIAFSVYSTLVVCLAAIPVYSTATEVTQMIAALNVALLLNSYLTLLCMYLPKLYAIHFGGDDLAIDTWRSNNLSLSSQVRPAPDENN